MSDATHDRSEQLNSPCATRPAPPPCPGGSGPEASLLLLRRGRCRCRCRCRCRGGRCGWPPARRGRGSRRRGLIGFPFFRAVPETIGGAAHSPQPGAEGGAPGCACDRGGGSGDGSGCGGCRCDHSVGGAGDGRVESHGHSLWASCRAVSMPAAHSTVTIPGRRTTRAHCRRWLDRRPARGHGGHGRVVGVSVRWCRRRRG